MRKCYKEYLRKLYGGLENQIALHAEIKIKNLKNNKTKEN